MRLTLIKERQHAVYRKIIWLSIVKHFNSGKNNFNRTDPVNNVKTPVNKAYSIRFRLIYRLNATKKCITKIISKKKFIQLPSKPITLNHYTN